MNAKPSGKSAKYSFGLLETPSSFVTSSSNEGSSSQHDDSTSSTTAPHTVNKTSMETSSNGGPAQRTSFSSNSIRRRGGTSSSQSSHLQTPARYTTGSVSSKSKTPGTFKTPRTPAARKTPKTPFGTVTSVSSASENVCSVIVAIVEGRGLARGEIGMASIDLKCPVLTMSQFSDTQRYVKTLTKLQILKPLEILLPNTACENGNATKLFQMISDEFQHSTISTVQRRYFNETKGLQYINSLCLPDYRTVEMEVSAKYYCLATAAALLKYVEFIQNIMFAPASLKIVFKGSEHTTMIDAVTARNLELLENQRDPKSSHTLYGVLNYTHTPGGARLLRSNILQPSSDLETVTLRQDVVRELTEKESVFFNLQGVLSRLLLDVDLLISHCVQIPRVDSVRVAEANINTVICLKHVLGLVSVLHEFLKDCENPLLKAYCKTLEDARFELIMSKINLVIHEDTMYQKGTLPMRTQKCFAVKPKVNGLLDVARRAYTEIVDDITAMVKQLGEQYQLPLKSAFSTVRGFYIQLYCGGKDSISAKHLPPAFVKVTKVKNTLNFTTPDLIKLNDRVENSLDEIYLMTNIVMKELLISVREFISVLYKFSEIVSTLDMLLSFAHACTLSSYVCPEFTDTLAIKQGRHPVLEKIGARNTVPNNTYAAEDSNFVVITGPNMSGKSTYLRQVALLQIMAQIGSFVPAEYASFRLTSHIFSRVGSDDHIETNSSTFTLEMKEINYIIQNATNNSLIIIDELGRGTSAQEGVGICWAVCEYLLKTKAFTFFVTHFSELTTLDTLYANVENYFFEVHRSFSREGNCEKITYTHIMSRGKTEEKHYGLRLAEMSTLPGEVLRDAQQLAEHLDTLRQKNQTVDAEVCRQRAVFKLGTKLLQLARNSRLEDQSLRAYLSSLLLQQSPHLRQQSPHLRQQPSHSSVQPQTALIQQGQGTAPAHHGQHITDPSRLCHPAQHLEEIGLQQPDRADQSTAEQSWRPGDFPGWLLSSGVCAEETQRGTVRMLASEIVQQPQQTQQLRGSEQTQQTQQLFSDEQTQQLRGGKQTQQTQQLHGGEQTQQTQQLHGGEQIQQTQQPHRGEQTQGQKPHTAVTQQQHSSPNNAKQWRREDPQQQRSQAEEGRNSIEEYGIGIHGEKTQDHTFPASHYMPKPFAPWSTQHQIMETMPAVRANQQSPGDPATSHSQQQAGTRSHYSVDSSRCQEKQEDLNETAAVSYEPRDPGTPSEKASDQQHGQGQSLLCQRPSCEGSSQALDVGRRRGLNDMLQGHGTPGQHQQYQQWGQAGSAKYPRLHHGHILSQPEHSSSI